MPKSRHVPLRTCVACGTIKPQRELVRLVSGEGNEAAVDTKGKMSGRGAYLCRSPECWKLGVKGNRLERALRIKLTPESREKLALDLEESFGSEVR